MFWELPYNPGAQAKKRRITSTAVRGTLRRSKYLTHHKTAASKRAKQSPAPEVACSLQPAPSSLQPATNLQPSIREARKPATCKPANLQPCNAWACKQPVTYSLQPGTGGCVSPDLDGPKSSASGPLLKESFCQLHLTVSAIGYSVDPIAAHGHANL